MGFRMESTDDPSGEKEKQLQLRDHESATILSPLAALRVEQDDRTLSVMCGSTGCQTNAYRKSDLENNASTVARREPIRNTE